jgi:hypothetical protein
MEDNNEWDLPHTVSTVQIFQSSYKLFSKQILIFVFTSFPLDARPVKEITGMTERASYWK